LKFPRLMPFNEEYYTPEVPLSTIVVKVNGQSHTMDVDPATPLLYILCDDLALRGPKFGCGLGQCGSCTVLAGGRAVRSCVTPVSAVAGIEVTTLEGLGTIERPHPIQQAFIDEQAAQCGFCLSGVILTAKAFLDRNPRATDTEIQQAMSGVLCRCFVHARMFRAIRRYADTRSAGPQAAAGPCPVPDVGRVQSEDHHDA
jgi:nicotinate dehydrogenase subunit A